MSIEIVNPVLASFFKVDKQKNNVYFSKKACKNTKDNTFKDMFEKKIRENMK